MHEVSLVEALVEAAEDCAGDSSVELVRVRFASTVPEVALRQAWELLTQDRPLATARLVAEPFEVRLHCGCGHDGVLEHDDVISATQAICPHCQALVTVPRTAELELREVRLWRDQPPSGSVATSRDAQPPATVMS